MLIDQNAKLRQLPSVHEIVAEVTKINEIAENYTAETVTWVVRKVLDLIRDQILGKRVGLKKENLAEKPLAEFEPILNDYIMQEVLKELREPVHTLKRVINATGVVLHTNCGRAPLASEVAEYIAVQALSYSNLELDLETGCRGSRYQHVEALLAELTGAEDSIVVNNNAAAVLLIMNTFANQKEVIVSRGELVEVGGSFRIPEVLKAGNAKLVEVGTTNKTWLKDYKDAITPDTALLLKVHTSNYRIEGFTNSVPVAELAQLGNEINIPVVEDLGSGSFIDGVDQGLPKEPTIQQAVINGASLVTFSGDKLLGGPQAGIIVGKKRLIEQLKKSQLTRALRVDKLTLAALEGTLRIYQRGEWTKIPVWRMLSKKKEELQTEAEYLQKRLKEIKTIEAEIEDNESCVGGGAFPTAILPSTICAVRTLKGSTIELEKFLRHGPVPILVRIVKDRVVFDPRTLFPEDYAEICLRLGEWESVN